MTTGSLCLTEILKSWKSCSSNSDASQTADSTSASGVALPYFSSSRLSSDPALTPMRSDVPRSLAACAICLTWSSNLRMLPGLTRTAAQPASIAAKTYFGWKWMSAITGICECSAISASASASSWDGHATRTMSQPAAVSSAICWSVVFTSAVRVVVIDCTETGASPPTSTLPTWIWRVFRRGASTGGGAAGIPRSTEVMWFLLLVVGSAERDRRDDVGVDQHHAHHQDHGGHHVGHGQQLRAVDEAGVGPLPQPGDPAAQCLVDGGGHRATVQRRERHQVEHAEEQVQPGEQQQQREELVRGRHLLLRGDLTGHPAGADDAHRAVLVPLLEAEGGAADVVELHRHRAQRLDGLPGAVAHRGEHEADVLLLQHDGRPDAEEADLRDPFGVRRVDTRRDGRAGVQGEVAPAPAYDDRGAAAAVAADGGLHLVPAVDRPAVERHDLITRSETGGLRRRHRVGGGAGAGRLGGVRLGHRDHALRDVADGGGGGAHAVAHEDDREEHERDDQVRHHAGAHHDELLPPRQLVEQPVLVALLH